MIYIHFKKSMHAVYVQYNHACCLCINKAYSSGLSSGLDTERPI